MAPFDVTTSFDYELRDHPVSMSANRHSAVAQTEIAAHATARPAQDQQNRYASRNFPAMRHDWRRVEWTERLLQLVDKDSIVTSIVFILLYTSVFESL